MLAFLAAALFWSNFAAIGQNAYRVVEIYL